MVYMDKIPLLMRDAKDRAIIEPHKEYLYEKKVGISPKINYPETCILCFQDEVVDIATKMFKPKVVEKILDSKLLEFTYSKKKIGIIRMSAGGPYAALVLERLIVRGFKKFLVIGTAGCLEYTGSSGKLFLVTKALRDEGVSFHYTDDENAIYTYPDKSTTEKIRRKLIEMKITFSEGPTWTIDAGYRETLGKVKKFRELGIKTVDMEASSIFSIASFRNVKVGCIFSISDMFTQDLNWDPYFHVKEVTDGLKSGFLVLLESV